MAGDRGIRGFGIIPECLKPFRNYQKAGHEEHEGDTKATKRNEKAAVPNPFAFEHRKGAAFRGQAPIIPCSPSGTSKNTKKPGPRLCLLRALRDLWFFLPCFR